MTSTSSVCHATPNFQQRGRRMCASGSPKPGQRVADLVRIMLNRRSISRPLCPILWLHGSCLGFGNPEWRILPRSQVQNNAPIFQGIKLARISKFPLYLAKIASFDNLHQFRRFKDSNMGITGVPVPPACPSPSPQLPSRLLRQAPHRVLTRAASR